MTKEKMMELWRKEFENSYYQWGLTPLVYKYLDGETEHPIGQLVTGRKYYAYYEDWIVKELDGENSELARRMLVVISKIRNGGLISGSYRIQDDAAIALRIGYDFESVVKESVNKFNDISAANINWLAGELLKYHPEPSKAFADRLFSDQLEEMVAKRKSTRDIYLALFLAMHLLKQDPTAHQNYLPVIENLAERLGGEHIIAFLYFSYTLSPRLKEMLLEQLRTNNQAARVVCLLTTAKKMTDFLREIGAPQWPYYYLVMTNTINDVNKPAVIRKLYQDDKPTFMELYGRLTKTNNPQEFTQALFLIATLLHNGEGQAELADSQLIQLGTFKRITSEYTDQKNIDFAAIADENLPLAELKEPIRFSRGMGWGTAIEIIESLSILYDHSSRVRRFISFLLRNAKKTLSGSNYNELEYIGGYFLRSRKAWLDQAPVDSLQLLLQSEGDYTLTDVFKTYCFAQVSCGWLQDSLAQAVTQELVEANNTTALELLTSGNMRIEEVIVWLDLLYGQYKNTNVEPLLDLLGTKSKIVRKKAEELINDKEADIRPLLEARMPKWKGDALAAAKRLIKRWDNERKFGANFVFTDNQTVIEFCQDNYDADNQKFISWIPEDMCTDIRFADLTEKAPAVVLKYILSEYLSLEEPYKIKVCDKVVDRLNPQDLQAALENIYRLWMDGNAEAKKKMIMVPYCIYGSDSQILRLKTQLKDWAEAARGAIAAFVVNAIAMNGGSVALMMIDGMSVKFPNNQVKNAAKAAFAFAAKALEIPEDELSDKIVPTLGFSREGEKVLDYGARTFTVTLMPDFSLSITDNDKQKVIKSMPAPAASDDTVKATAAKKEFSELKKQIKATVDSQTNRLEKVLLNGRRWSVAAWNELFVENPIMHRFATGLIWGVYEKDELVATFRYMDDGTFNTVDEDEYTLPAEASISLVHPVELPAETLEQWREQLSDYEVVQPLPQLSAPVVALEDKDTDGKKVKRYDGTVTQSGKIAGLAKKYNLVRGEVWDGGSYTCFHWVDKVLNIAALLNFEYMWMGQEYNESVTLKEVVFYRLDEEQNTSDEPKESMILAPDAVPARFVSTIIGMFDKLTEA